MRVSTGLVVFVGVLVTSLSLFSGFLIGARLVGGHQEVNAGTLVQQSEELSQLKEDLAGEKARAGELEKQNDRLSRDIDWLFARVSEGFVHLRKIHVEKSKFAYPLVEPKLMLSVTSLKGGPIIANFGTETHVFSVGERFDFPLKDCDCFLLLESSARGEAVFSFGCQRRSKSDEA